MFKDKILLISGGTGSFGDSILRRFLTTDIKEIRVFSRDELKQDEMRRHYSNNKLKFYIGDVRDKNSIDDAMRGVDYVFHAAALKQVPSCEFYPMEAVKTNILGAENVLEAAYHNNVENVIVLSTDKAVYPINAMGLSKSMMEKLMLAKSRESSLNSTYSATRYGNVMGSRGSVIPLFISQIKSGKPLTITDPNMTRFMMNIDESVDLVNFAFENANPGDIFVQKSPAATLEILVEALLHIFDANNEVQIIGTRHSEKLYETLLTREEVQRAEDLGDYFRVPSDNRDLNYAQYFTKGIVKTAILEDYHSHNTERLDLDGMIKKLLNLDVVLRELNNDKQN